MRQIEISKLERLANQPNLIPSLDYSNPDRKEDLFYDFIKVYGYKMGFTFTENKFGFIDEIKREIQIIKFYLTYPKIHPKLRVHYGIFGSLNFLSLPISYPLFGGVEAIVVIGDEIIIELPKYVGIDLFTSKSGKPHEYLHAYHHIAVRDLKQRGVLPNIDGYLDIGLMEPQLEIPTFSELKSFEKKFLNAMIKEESKYL